MPSGLPACLAYFLSLCDKQENILVFNILFENGHMSKLVKLPDQQIKNVCSEVNLIVTIYNLGDYYG